MSIKNIQLRFTSGNDISIDKAAVTASEWHEAMLEIKAIRDEVRFKMGQAYERGWVEAACWAKRGDLCDDIGSLAYINARDSHLDNVVEMESK